MDWPIIKKVIKTDVIIYSLPSNSNKNASTPEGICCAN
jgi:hypothetical protein